MDDGFTCKISMGLEAIGAMLLDNGLEASIFNLAMTPWDDALRQIEEYHPDLIGITSMTHDRFAVMKLVDILKERIRDAKIALGGVHVSCVFDLTLRKHASVDYIAIGEGENSFLELVRRLEAGESTYGIKGIVQRKPGFDYDKPRKPVVPVDGACEGPYADFDWVGAADTVKDLGELAIPSKYYKYENVSTARGCPFNCSFCNSAQVWGRKVRYRPVPHVIEELTYLRDKHQVKRISFKDETFTMHRKRVIEICKAMDDTQMQLLWTCDTRVDCIDEQRLYWLRKAGCIYVSLGVESGSERLLNEINKKTNLTQAKEAAELCRKYGLLVRFYMMLGLPSETEEDREASVKLVEDCKPHYVSPCILGILPGTDAFERYCKEFNTDNNIWFEDTRYMIPYYDDKSWEKTPASKKLLAYGARDAESGYTGLNSSYTEDELLEIQSRIGDCFTTNYDVAKIQFSNHKYTRALANYQRALEIWPDHTKARVESAICLLYTNGAENPGDVFSRLIQECDKGAGNEPELWFNLGDVAQKLLNSYSQAEYCFRKVLELHPIHVQTMNILGSMLERQLKHTDALDIYKNVLALSPYNEHAVRGMVRIYKTLLQAGTGTMEMVPIFTKLCSSLGQTGEAIKTIERMLGNNTTTLQPLQRASLHYSLGHLLDTAGEFDKAFANYRLANEKRPVQYNPRATSTGFEAIAKWAGREHTDALPRSDINSSLPIFIIGMPCSGVELVERVLAEHPQVHGAGEQPIIQQMIGPLLQSFGNQAEYPECLSMVSKEELNRMGNSYLQHLNTLNPDATRVINSFTGNLLHLGLIQRILPNARVIHCKRSPQATCLSCYFEDFNDRYPYSADLGWLGSFYRGYEMLMEKWRQNIALSMFEVNYEELVSDPERVSRELVEFCGLGWENPRSYEGVCSMSTLGQRRLNHPKYLASVGHWKNYQGYLSSLNFPT